MLAPLQLPLTHSKFKMAEEIPVFPNVGSILINTGNIVNWNRLKRKPSRQSKDELVECLNVSISDWIVGIDKTEAQYMNDLEIISKRVEAEKLTPEEREQLKITVKIFMGSLDPTALSDAVSRAMSDLGTTFIETVLVSFPEKLGEDLESIKPLWNRLEDFHADDTVYGIGVCDMSKDLLEQLYDWAKVKPCINQVNLESCCVMPPELTEYAKENDVQLLTHNDPREILSIETLQDVIRGQTTEDDAQLWQPSWVLRYSAMVKCRGIIKTKGYITKATRDIKKKKL
ncbi:unnamed protein product [Owenia fusiformis]|uniref:GCS light chain n=1 Tax=Owenia fusiformis TaxID=6347 RepID=A0A8J1XW59_OWEFU|nr:unnamed protein product [Owenia fusiformis]